MFSAFPEGCHEGRNESHGYQRQHICRIHIRLYQILKNLVVTGQCIQDPPPGCPALSHPVIIVPCPALVTTELLVCAAVPDLVPAFQTDGHMSHILLINHCQCLFN